MKKRLEVLKTKIEANPTIAEKMVMLETPEEVQAFLEDQGISFSLDEISKLKETLVKVMALEESDELTDEALEDVAGGAILATTLAVIGAVVSVLGAVGAGAQLTHNVTRRRW